MYSAMFSIQIPIPKCSQISLVTAAIYLVSANQSLGMFGSPIVIECNMHWVC